MLSRRCFSIICVTIFCGAYSHISLAHHSTAGFFDSSSRIEIAGEVTKILWRNPHTIFELDVTDEQGVVTEWSVESGSLSILRAQGLSGDILKEGDFVKILGDESIRGLPEMFARNLLLPDGNEVLLTLGAREHFSNAPDVTRLVGDYDQEEVDKAIANAEGIFRVWSRIGDNVQFRGTIFNGNSIRSMPFTDQGKAIHERWDPSAEFILGCTDWNMPRLMGNPQPMEFVRDGENILLKFEEGDALRTIHMNADMSSAPDEYSLMGYSIGRWDGDALIVETSQIEESSHEMPVSRQMTLTERFEVKGEDPQLHYELTLVDPTILTEPVTKTLTWDWRPEMQVIAYECEQVQEF